MAKHAEVIIDGMKIPLIGIAPKETEQECDLCHDILPIQMLELNPDGNQWLCKKCRETTETKG